MCVLVLSFVVCSAGSVDAVAEKENGARESLAPLLVAEAGLEHATSRL